MKNIQPLSRQVEVLIGPLAEWQGGGQQDQAIRMYGDGTNEHFRIKFSIPKHIVSTASPTKISIYNLSPESRGALKLRGLQVIINIGWENVGMLSLFQGSLLTSVSGSDGSDIITDLLCRAAVGAISRTTLSKTFGANYHLSDMLIDIAKELPNVSVDKKLIKVKNVSMGNQGYSFAGSANDLLDELSRVHGFSWWINDNLFHALDDEKVFTRRHVIISANNGFLNRAEPILATPFQKQTGISIDSLLNPLVEPGGSVQLESRINPALNGTHKAIWVTHSGDTHSDEWSTSIQTWTIGHAVDL